MAISPRPTCTRLLASDALGRNLRLARHLGAIRDDWASPGTLFTRPQDQPSAANPAGYYSGM
jgi:hypothetical protein